MTLGGLLSLSIKHYNIQVLAIQLMDSSFLERISHVFTLYITLN